MAPVELSIVVPTYKERGNVAELVRRLDAALVGIAWEAIYVDDNSPDGTAEAVKVIAADLQHDEKVLPLMLARLQAGEADLVAGTRYVEGGSAASFARGRGFLS